MPEGVAGFSFRRVAEKTAHIGIALDIRNPRKIEITSIRLRLAREGILQVFVTLCAP
jgi:hypothetical protein